MAAGDFYIRRNNADTSAVPNAGGGNEDAAWDTLVEDTTDGTGGVFTYSDPNIQLDIGLYLIMYSEHFYTIDTTNNERVEIQGEIHVSGTGAVGGYGSDYIRKSSGQQECVVSGYMILDVTGDNTDVFIRFYRTDNSVSGTVNRVVGYGGVQILELDSTDNYGFYSTSSSEATSGTTARTLNINTNDQQDTGFSRSGTIVTVSNAGRYLMTYSMDLSTTGTVRENVRAWLSRNGTTTKVVGSQSHSYLRGSDSNQDSALTWMGIVDVSASDTFQIRWDCPTSQTITCAAGATLQIWQIPSGDECIMEATTGDYSSGDFTWDTVPHIDTGSFTASVNSSNIDVGQICNCLVFGTCSQVVDSSVQRGYPIFRIKNNTVNANYTAGGGYHRNSSTYGFALTVAGIAINIPSNGSLEINSAEFGASGALANTSGQFSVLNLESLWNYSYPSYITNVNTNEQIDIGETGVTITGENFETSQGTGKIELWDDTVGTTKVTQTATSWASDTYLEFTAIQGTLDEGPIYVVVTNNSGKASLPYIANLGKSPYDPVTSTDADLYWTMNNTYEDTGARSDNKPFNAVQRGNYSFQTTPICRNNTHSWYVPDNGGSEPANSDYTNITNNHTYRNIGGWFRTTALQKYPGIIYEEGGGINNIYILMMPNGRLMANVADSNGVPDFKHQHYSDFTLKINRNYYLHLDIQFADHFDLWIDGVKQTSTKGGTLGTDLTMSTHSGDWSFGDPGANLDTGGVDIAYDACNPMYLAHWGTWSGVGGGSPLSDAQIRDELFRDGALAEHTIYSGTESAMQTTMETYDNQTHADKCLTYNVSKNTDDTNFTLDLTNQVWPNEVKFQINYTGYSQLTIRNIGTSNFQTSRAYSPTSGTFVVIETALITITVKDIDAGTTISGAMVLIEAGPTGPLTEGDEIMKTTTDGSGEAIIYLDYTSDQSITGSVRKGSSSTYYKAVDIVGTVTSSGLTKTVLMIKDE